MTNYAPTNECIIAGQRIRGQRIRGQLALPALPAGQRIRGQLADNYRSHPRTISWTMDLWTISASNTPPINKRRN